MRTGQLSADQVSGEVVFSPDISTAMRIAGIKAHRWGVRVRVVSQFKGGIKVCGGGGGGGYNTLCIYVVVQLKLQVAFVYICIDDITGNTHRHKVFRCPSLRMGSKFQLLRIS